MITLTRIDDRLIHGQVQTNWIQISKAKNIMVVDDNVRYDEIASQVLKFATPAGMKLKICDVQEAADYWEKAIKSKNNIMVLMKTIETAGLLLKKGISFDEILVGPVSKKENAIEVVKGTYFLPEEILAAQELFSSGTEIYFQQTPDERKINWKEINI